MRVEDPRGPRADQPRGHRTADRAGGVMDPGARVLGRLAGFTATLRDNGFAIGLAEAGDAARIVASPLAARPIWLCQAFRAGVCSDEEERRKIDRGFGPRWLDSGD